MLSLFADGLDLTPLLSMIPPPWNLVAMFGLGVLAKIIHNRVKKPTPAPAPVDPSKPDQPAPAPVPDAPSKTPIRDWLRIMLDRLLNGLPVPNLPTEKMAFGAMPEEQDLTPEQAMDIYKAAKAAVEKVQP